MKTGSQVGTFRAGKPITSRVGGEKRKAIFYYTKENALPERSSVLTRLSHTSCFIETVVFEAPAPDVYLKDAGNYVKWNERSWAINCNRLILSLKSQSGVCFKALQPYAFRVELNIKERVRLARSRFTLPARSANEEEWKYFERAPTWEKQRRITTTLTPRHITSLLLPIHKAHA